MAAGRFARLGLGIVVLLALVAMTAGAPRPLGLSHAYGALNPTLTDYTFTTLTLALVALGAIAIYALARLRKEDLARAERPSWWRTLLFMMALAAFVLLLQRAHPSSVGHVHTLRPPPIHTKQGRERTTRNARSPQFEWPEAAALAAVALLLAAIAVARNRRRDVAPPVSDATPALDVARALDESLDDLRGEQDVRRAVIAAYARMERALAAAGLPRRASEAPVEYLERALRALAASAASVGHLTELFERAKFSHHPLGPSAKEQAIAALVAVRDEVRAAT